MDLKTTALEFHKKHQGKIAMQSKVPLATREDMTLAYTPGVAAPCLEIEKKPESIYDYTAKGNWVAVVTNGTAVLGLGDIGAAAGLPVMEGKAVLFKTFSGIDAFPVCISSKDTDEIVRTVELIAPSFGGINLEDIKAPECFEVERRLKELLDIPVFHDDQHGTAIVANAALFNALRVVGKSLAEVKIVINGAGAAGTAIGKLMLAGGAKNVIMCDRQGALYRGMPEISTVHAALAEITNPDNEKGSLAEVLRGADVFLGVSAPNIVSVDMVRSMNNNAIVFAMANPNPEIYPDDAKKGGARIIGTGRSDFPNQINNVLAFPGIFRGALDVRARDINEEMKVAAARAIAGVISDEDLNENYIIPDALDRRIAPAVAAAVAAAAIESGVARAHNFTPDEIAKRTKNLAAQ